MHSTFVVHSRFEHLRPQFVKLINDFAEVREFVTQGERNVIKKVTIEGTTFNIKSFRKPSFFQGLVYQFLRKSKARRSFEYASKLIDCSINTPHPIAYFEKFSFGLKESYYISEHIHYDFDFRDLIHKPNYPQRVEILKQFTAFSFQLRRLWLSKTMISVIAAEYAKLYNIAYDVAHASLSAHSRSFQKKVNSKKLRRKRRL